MKFLPFSSRVFGLALALAAGACDDGGPGKLYRTDFVDRGDQCPAGGVIISSGIDHNGNGVLDDDEIDAVEPLCNDPTLAVLVREDTLEPGDECANGGIAVHTGVDDNGDGVLDDDEIDDTVIACADTDIWRGTFRAEDWQDPKAVARLQMARVVTGSLVIATDDDVALPVLETVGGGVLVDGELRNLDLPGLRSVGAEIQLLSHNLTELEFPRLEQLGNLLVFETRPMDLRAPALVEAAGQISFYVDVRGAVEMPRLRTVGKHLFLGGVHTSLGFAALEDVGGSLQLWGRAPALHLPALRHIGGSLEVREFGSVTMPALQNLGGDIDYASDTIAAVAFPALQDVGGEIYIRRCDSLQAIELPALQELRERLYIAANAALELIDLRALRTVGGDFWVHELEALETLDVSSLEVVEGRLWIRATPALATLPLAKLERVVPAPVAEFETGVFVVDTGVSELDLGQLRTVVGALEVDRNPALERVALPLLSTAEGLFSFENPALREWASPQLQSVVRLDFRHSPLLETLDLSRLRSAERFLMLFDLGLEDLLGLEALTTAGNLTVRNLDQLGDLEGLNSLNRAHDLTIAYNDSLRTVDGLEGLTVLERSLIIHTNPMLESLAGLESLAEVGGLFSLYLNPNLLESEIEELRARLGK